ncbi:hypothetical protein AB0G69_10245 [Streptomyces sp. NPDC020947]|uniref:hypothetical protein n=1 Tax=Streptomyces sp. NPDC020947 TaxID=3154989 RepID=UPI0033DA5F5B
MPGRAGEATGDCGPATGREGETLVAGTSVHSASMVLPSISAMTGRKTRCGLRPS